MDARAVVTTKPDGVLGGIAPWYGSKRDDGGSSSEMGLNSLIVAECGKSPGFYEAQCASLAVTLSKPKVSMEYATDLHGDCINLARVLASARYRELYERVDRTLIHSEIHEEAKSIVRGEAGWEDVAPGVNWIEDRHLERAYWFLVSSWQGINGVTGTQKQNVNLARRFTVGGGHSGTRWDNVGRSIPWWHARLKSVLFDRTSCFEIAPALADDGTWVIYSDPPYIKKGHRYVHDWAPEQHAEWAGILRAKKDTRIVVSYYDHPTVRELYRGWTVIEAHKTKALVSQGKRDKENKTVAPEILLINGPSLTAGGLWS